tara:strand:+ start:1648 stop:2109 length:462 start_codon:yes stop_codon:yes gene_type:complete
MKTVKTISGEILLYFYLLQRQDVGQLKDARVSFGFWQSRQDNNVSGVQLDRRSESIFGVDDFKEYTDNDLYNAIVYLSDSGLIDFKDSPDNTGSNLFNFKVSAYGIDIVEGIERGEEEKKVFNMTFNFNINNDVTVESLLKAEFGALFKASVL